MARLFRRKSKRLVARGTYAHLGGIVGLGNFHTARALVSRSFEEVPSVRNHEGVLPGFVKALDDLFNVAPTAAAKIIRELMHTAFIYEDHLLHFFYLGGPDLLMGSGHRGGGRNVFGVIGRLGEKIEKKVIQIRKRVRGLNALISGSPLYPVCGLPGGVSKSVSEKERAGIREIAADALAFARQRLRIFEKEVLKDAEYGRLMQSKAFSPSKPITWE